MAKHTSRDLCWKIALTKCHRLGKTITSAELADGTPVTERTARDVLKTMADADLLDERKDGKTTRYAPHDGAWVPSEER